MASTPARIPGVPFIEGRNDYHDTDGRKYAICIHNTSNNASDTAEANYARRRTDGVSSHLYADADSVTQSLELTDKAGHVGSRQGNENAYAVEIVGANGKPRSWWLANVAWDRLGLALAWIIRNDPDLAGFQVRRASVAEMRRNPKVKAFYAHDDARRAWGHTTHTDPGPHFPWDRLFKAVNDGLTKLGRPSTPAPPTKPAHTATEKIVKALPTLRHGSAGTGVKRAQALLNVMGYRLKEDGDYGDNTAAAVATAQGRARITVDRIVGLVTWSVLLDVR
ncbi:peptidoglycan-binding domain-containing protein [Actinoplanes sp. NPDC026623]|uniref:peptidoglycan recognition protein family protein n=1 Tax=Actinoplanes sp. NPDC026623 TaxID=3155610 RepID=UPI0033FF4308